MDKTELEYELLRASNEMVRLESQLSRAVTYVGCRDLFNVKYRIQSLCAMLKGELTTDASYYVGDHRSCEPASQP